MFTPEGRAFMLEGTRTGKLATVRPDGRSHVVPVWFVMDGDTIIFTTGEDTIKGRNIRRDNRVTICVDDETPPFAYAQVDGLAATGEDPAELLKWATRIAARYMGDNLAEAYGKRNAVPGELLVRVTPTRVIFKTGIADWD